MGYSQFIVSILSDLEEWGGMVFHGWIMVAAGEILLWDLATPHAPHLDTPYFGRDGCVKIEFGLADNVNLMPSF